jgi:type II secretory ATPase GspE/PulE/Tfp pilus assembly ATPase PilB-like protein
MALDWSELDEVEATDYIFRCAAGNGASEVTIARDNRGASIFFSAEDRLETFEHIPPEVCSRVCRYLKHSAAIDPYQAAPQEGVCTIVLDGESYTLTVQTVAGCVGEDLSVKVMRL